MLERHTTSKFLLSLICALGRAVLVAPVLKANEPLPGFECTISVFECTKPQFIGEED